MYLLRNVSYNIYLCRLSDVLFGYVITSKLRLCILYCTIVTLYMYMYSYRDRIRTRTPRHTDIGVSISKKVRKNNKNFNTNNNYTVEVRAGRLKHIIHLYRSFVQIVAWPFVCSVFVLSY